jgi:ribosomal protein S18 acetylase RimI-like enzyme
VPAEDRRGRLDGSMNETIAWSYPYPIAAPYEKIFTTTDPERRLQRLVDAIISSLEFLAICALADITQRWPAEKVDHNISLRARTITIKPQLGDFHAFFRDSYLRYARDNGIDTFFAPAAGLGTFLKRVYTEDAFAPLVALRNDVVKRPRQIASEARRPGYVETRLQAFTDAVLRLEALGRCRLIVPLLHSATDGTVTYGMMRGCIPEMTMASALLFPPGENPRGVILYESADKYLPLAPLLAFAPCRCGEPCLGTEPAVARVQWGGTGAGNPRFFDMFSNHLIVNADVEQDFARFTDSLAADYKYQRDPFLQGADVRALEYSVHLDVLNPLGDARNTHRIRIQQIKVASRKKPVLFKVDYHDQEPPIPDGVFDLRVRDLTKGEDWTVDEDAREIWNDSFRSFSVGVPSPLEFEEERLVEVSMFEPGLFNADDDTLVASPNRRTDYYEISTHVPVESFSLRLTLAPGTVVKKGSIQVRYLEDKKKKIDVVGGPTCEATADGREEIAVVIRRPDIHRNIFLTFAYERSVSGDFDAPLPWYWTAFNLYKRLGQEGGEEWTLRALVEKLEEWASPPLDSLVERQARPPDLPALAGLFQDANPHANIDEIQGWTRLTLERPARDGVVRMLEGNGGVLVGAFAAWREDSVATLDDIAVHPSWRRRGVGRRLWDGLLRWARDVGVERIRLEVHYGCARALPWYYGLGARLKEIRPDHFGPGGDALLLEVIVASESKS